jgi:SAM-dependent methyltransferase
MRADRSTIGIIPVVRQPDTAMTSPTGEPAFPPSPSFKDHFSDRAGDYRAHRPRYPDALYDVLAAAAPGRDLAWDAGCGNGQLSVGLARHFARVVATDASPQQIASAEPHPRVRYAAAPAGASGLAGGSVDLVTVAQAAHWFDLDAFYGEVRRVTRPGGALALISYGVLTLGEAIDPLVLGFYEGVLGPFWPPERRHVDAGYSTLPFPFAGLPVPPLAMAVDWTLAQFLGYLGTWSALRPAARALGGDPLAEFAGRLAPAWGEPDRTRTVTWPVTVRLGIVSGTSS